jgi:signal transduction histidine kinase/ligand-binding sensor domain-containing protein/CheY-like chemotaxis protein
MRLEKTLLFILYCLSLNHLSAQPEEYLFSHVDVTYGLSNNHITSIFKDARGFMWFGTVSGLNRYDGYQTRVFKHDARDPHSIADNYIEQIFEGPGGKMWVESRKRRYAIYDACLDRFEGDFASYLKKLGLPVYELLTIAPSRSGYWFIYRDSGIYHYMNDGKIVAFRPNALSGLPVAAAQEDGNGNCWVVHDNGLLEEIDGRRNEVIFRLPALEREFGNVPMTACRLFIDAQDDLWLFSNGVFKGTYYYHPPTHGLRHFALDAGERRLNSNIVLTALQDKKGLIWLATDHGGVDIVDKRNFSVKFVTHVEDDNKSIAENSITSLYRDNGGTVWLGTYKNGISFYHQDNFQFPQYRHEPNRPGTLPFEDVNSFAEDAAGNIWIGANGGGLLYFDRKKNSFRQWLHDPRNPNSLCSNIIVSLLLDKEGKLWIGTYFGGLDCFDGQHFMHFRHDDKDPYSLADDRVMCLCEDGEGQLWVGTLSAGMDRLDRRRKVFYHYRANLPNSIHNDYVSSIITDKQDNLWIGTGWGIDVIEKNTGNIRHYSTDYNQLSSDNVTWLYMDSKERLWAATREGLDVLAPDEKMFQAFTTEDGLPDNTIRDIEEDSLHRLWVSTANGLSRISVVPAGDHGNLRIRCRNFHEQDGLQGREFNERTGLVTSDGSLLFGGPNGFNIFRPGDIAPGRRTPPILLTGLEVFDKTIRVGDQSGGHVILQKALTETGDITLTHHDNVFSIEFASLGYIPNAANRYAYKLEGFNHNWLITDGKIRKATYTNLDAGDYLFHVKASDEDGEWYDQEAKLRITVLPPWWRTELAYILYTLLLAGSLLLARWMVLRRARARFVLENERRETRRMHEMDMMKIRFFTNMSHELRTPLSLILAPVDKLLNQTPQSEPRRQYEMIRRNARRLLHLVNQLLDFRKMEEGELKLHLREGDVIRFVREISLSFIDLAERKNIHFSLNEEGVPLITRFDHDKLERILFNLLSNAFKFTPENGSVTVNVQVERKIPGARDEDETVLTIAITDTGIGIEPDKQEKIFERFFQNEMPDTILNQGSGIGLSITQEFVRMHGGKLSVSSQVNKGSCFTVMLPFREILVPGSCVAQPNTVGQDQTPGPGKVPTPAAGSGRAASAISAPKGAPSILIVEDNEDFRFYLKDNLRGLYKIIEAADGKEGWKKVLAEQPQLVVSDISMPHMDGIQLCRKIRTDERTRQIPVILLTAMSGETIELEGLQTGATDYISKPFNFEVLLSKIRNVVEFNETVRKTWQRRVETGPAPVEKTSPDELFLREVLEYVEKNIGDPDLSVEALSQRFHSSRSTFYKRLLLLTGKTPVEFIRHTRLQRAADLLEKSQLTVAEIAYTVGFNNPKYFTQYFKSAFDCIPSAYRAARKEGARASGQRAED